MMKYYIGIDLGGTNIVAGVVDEQFQLIAKASEKTLVGRPAIEIAKSMAKAARTAAQNAGVPMEQIEMVGIGSPGIVDNQKKEVIYALFPECPHRKDGGGRAAQAGLYRQ